MDTGDRRLAGIALAGWLLIAAMTGYSALISPIFSCGVSECIPTAAFFAVLIGFFCTLFLLAELVATLRIGIQKRRWSLTAALLGQAVISVLCAANLAFNYPLASAFSATFHTAVYGTANWPYLGLLPCIMMASPGLVLLTLPRTFPRPPRMLPALVCVAIAGGADIIVGQSLLRYEGVLSPSFYAVLTVTFVVGWAAATAAILWAYWAASHGKPMVSGAT